MGKIGPIPATATQLGPTGRMDGSDTSNEERSKQATLEPRASFVPFTSCTTYRIPTNGEVCGSPGPICWRYSRCYTIDNKTPPSTLTAFGLNMRNRPKHRAQSEKPPGGSSAWRADPG